MRWRPWNLSFPTVPKSTLCMPVKIIFFRVLHYEKWKCTTLFFFFPFLGLVSDLGKLWNLKMLLGDERERESFEDSRKTTCLPLFSFLSILKTKCCMLALAHTVSHAFGLVMQIINNHTKQGWKRWYWTQDLWCDLHNLLSWNAYSHLRTQAQSIPT